MAALTNTQISVTYVGLLKTSANTVLSSSGQQITDGEGNNSVLFLSTAGVGIGGAASSGKELDVTGNVLVTGDLQVDNINIDGNTISATSGVVTLANGAIATTQSQNDNSTKIATTSYVDTAINAIDTLAEILAIGNTTGGTDIAVSANDDITFTSSSKAIFGPSQDLQIYSDGSNNYIDSTSNELRIRSNDLRLLNFGSAKYITADSGADVSLYFNDSKKLETTSTGVSVTGNGAFSGNITINGDATLGDGTADNHTINGQVTHLTADSLGYKLHRTAGSTSMLISASSDAEIEFGTDNGSGTNTTHWTIGKDGTDNSFRISNSASLGTSDALRIDSSENSTFSGNVELKSDAGNATRFLRIHNQGTAANDDAVLSWTAQASRTYSMGIHRDSGNLVITNADASVASGDIINIDNSGNATFAGQITTTQNQITTDIGTTSAIRLKPAATTDSGGKSSIFLGTSTADNFGISLRGARNSGSGTPTFELATHNNSNNGTLALSIDNSQNSTFAGAVEVNGNFVVDGAGTSTDFQLRRSANAAALLTINAPGGSPNGSVFSINGNSVMTLDENQNATFAGDAIFGGTSFEDNNSLARKIEIAAASPVGLILNDTRDTHPMSIDNSGAVMNLRYNTTAILSMDGATSASTFAGSITTADKITIANSSASQTSPTTQLLFDNNNIADGGGYNIDFKSSSNDTADRFMSRIQALRGSSATSSLGFFTETGSALNRALLLDSSQNAIFAADIEINDSGQIYLGTGNDSQIYHNGSHLFIDNSTGNSYFRNTSTSGIIIRNSNGGDIQLDNEFAGNIFFTTSNVERMRIDSSGNVGIGTSTIPNPFSGAYSNILQVGTTSGHTRLAITSGDDKSCDLTFADSNDATNAGSTIGSISYKHDLNAMLFSTNGGERMRIDSSGNVLIGSTSAAAGVLVVDGNSANNIWVVGRDSDGTGSLSFRNAADNAYNARLEAVSGALKVETNGTLALTIDSSQDATFSGTIDSGTITSTGVVKAATTFQSTSGSMLFFVPNVGQALEIAQNTGNATFAGAITSGAHLINASSSAFGGSSVQGVNTDFLVDSGQGYARINSYHTGGGNIQFLTNAASSTTNSVALELSKDNAATFAGDVNLADSKKLNVGAGSDLQIFHNGTNSVIDNNTNNLFIQTASQTIITSDATNNQLTLGHSSGNWFAKATNSNTLIIGSESNATNNITLDTTNGGSATFGGQINGIGGSAGAPSYIFEGNTDTGFFHPATDAIGFSTAGSEKMRLTSGGEILFGTTGTPNGTSFYGSGFIPVSTGKVALRMASSSTSAGTLIEFFNPNGTVGNITISASATAFNTSSDYRLKEDLQDFAGLDMVSKIPVYDFKWKADDNRSYGVMAHELEEVLPQAVNGEKDAEEMQSVDYSKIVPLLVKSIQELKKEIEILKSK